MDDRRAGDGRVGSLANLSGAVDASNPGQPWSALTVFAIREVAGGIGLRLALGYVGYRAPKIIDDHWLELLITLATADSVSACAVWRPTSLSAAGRG